MMTEPSGDPPDLLRDAVEPEATRSSASPSSVSSPGAVVKRRRRAVRVDRGDEAAAPLPGLALASALAPADHAPSGGVEGAGLDRAALLRGIYEELLALKTALIQATGLRPPAVATVMTDRDATREAAVIAAAVIVAPPDRTAK